MRGTKDNAAFESRPSGATVTAESISEDKLGPFTCVAPCELELKRKRTWAVEFTLEGYKPASGLLKPKLTGGGLASGAGNALLGGIVGVGIDAGTGANLDLRPNPMIAELEPLDSALASRVLDADPVVEAAAAGDEATPAEAPEALAPDAAPDTAPDAAVDDAADAAADDAADAAASVAPDVDETASVATSTTPEQPAAQPVRLYKPGERAPNDEESDDLNRRQLDKIENLPQP
ncbi:MAG: hypothetical protein A3E78_12715 [Alphaproteobacteria bacterium RIFCSPHIGHO2_12_FULL_63_12]|nr:MAG: hypothetical protein A3E78_12715 [Alphaproteobacteria bacterium RIFCSPHIGHO2_12_FULL_63_12]